jgi:hypothetical protein
MFLFINRISFTNKSITFLLTVNLSARKQQYFRDIQST